MITNRVACQASQLFKGVGPVAGNIRLGGKFTSNLSLLVDLELLSQIARAHRLFRAVRADHAGELDLRVRHGGQRLHQRL